MTTPLVYEIGYVALIAIAFIRDWQHSRSIQ